MAVSIKDILTAVKSSLALLEWPFVLLPQTSAVSNSISPDWSPVPPAKPFGPCWGLCPVSAAAEPAWWSRKRAAWASLWIRPQPPAARPPTGSVGPLVSLKLPCEDGPPPILEQFSLLSPTLAEPRPCYLVEMRSLKCTSMHSNRCVCSSIQADFSLPLTYKELIHHETQQCTSKGCMQTLCFQRNK